jgi:hypothetical protein
MPSRHKRKDGWCKKRAPDRRLRLGIQQYPVNRSLEIGLERILLTDIEDLFRIAPEHIEVVKVVGRSHRYYSIELRDRSGQSTRLSRPTRLLSTATRPALRAPRQETVPARPGGEAGRSGAIPRRAASWTARAAHRGAPIASKRVMASRRHVAASSCSPLAWATSARAR